MSSKKELLTSRQCGGCPLASGARSSGTATTRHRRPVAAAQEDAEWHSAVVLPVRGLCRQEDERPQGQVQGQASETSSSRRHGRAAQEVAERHTPEDWCRLPPPVELDPVVMPVRETRAMSSTDRLTASTSTCRSTCRMRPPSTAAEGMSSTDRRKALLDRIRAKEQANSSSVGDSLDRQRSRYGDRRWQPPTSGAALWPSVGWRCLELPVP